MDGKISAELSLGFFLIWIVSISLALTTPTDGSLSD